MTYLNDGEMIMNNDNEPPARVHIGTICGAETSFPLTVALTVEISSIFSNIDYG